MTPEDKLHVQSTFYKLVPMADEVAHLFYEELFNRYPSVRDLFPEDMTEQRRKLMAMLAQIIGSLKDWNKVSGMIQALGARHDSYGVNDEQYHMVGAALLATLEKGLGADFTLDVRRAWTNCYELLAREMRAAS